MNQYKHYEQLIECAPLPAAILDAEGHRLIAANDAVLEAWHRTPEIIGRELLDFMPELAAQPYPKILNYVVRSGQIWEEKKALVRLNRSGRKEDIPTDYSYTPIFGNNGKTTAVLLLGAASEPGVNGLLERANQQALINIVEHSKAGICVYRGPNFEVEAINESMLKLWRGEPKRRLEVLQHVYVNGVPYTVHDKGLSYQYMPLGMDRNGRTGVYIVAKIH